MQHVRPVSPRNQEQYNYITNRPNQHKNNDDPRASAQDEQTKTFFHVSYHDNLLVTIISFS